MKAVRTEYEWIWRKGFVKEMSFKSGVKGRGSDRWWEKNYSYSDCLVGGGILQFQYRNSRWPWAVGSNSPVPRRYQTWCSHCQASTMLLSHLSAACAAVLTNQPVLQCKRANLPEAGNLQNSILSLEMLSLYSAACGTCPLVPSCRHYDWVQRKLELRRYVDMFWHNTDRQTRPRLSVHLQCRRTFCNSIGPYTALSAMHNRVS